LIYFNILQLVVIALDQLRRKKVLKTFRTCYWCDRREVSARHVGIFRFLWLLS